MKLLACLFSSLVLISLTACGSARVSPAGLSTNRLTASNARTSANTSAPVSAQTYARTIVTPAEEEQESEESTHSPVLYEEDVWE